MKTLDLLNLGYIWISSYPALRKLWSSEAEGSEGEGRVNYGMESVPGPHEHVFGGMVKLQDLQATFPNERVHPDLLYLVSSALPYFPARMARMAKESGASLVINQNGVAYPGWFGEGWERQNRPMRKLHALADHIFYQSQFCKESADQFVGRCDTEYEILYNPVDTRVFCPKNVTERNAIAKDDGPLSLLLAGSHWSSYRPLVAVEVLRLLVEEGGCDLILTIAGRFCWEKDPAQAKQQVVDHALRCGVADRVVFSGPYRQNEAVDLFRSSSILLHTKYNDPCPRLVVEAMSCGLPVVYSASGGVPELVGDDAGIGVAGPLSWERDYPPRAEELAGAVTEVIAHLPQYAEAARRRAVENFDINPWIRRHQEVFGQLQQR